MSLGINSCHFLGNLGKKPEMRHTNAGLAVVNFSIACTEKLKTAEGYEEKTEWVNVVVFGKMGEACEKWLGKGSQVYVSGRLQQRKWSGRDGVDRYVAEIVAREVRFCDSNKSLKDEGHETGDYGPGEDIPTGGAPF